jgi:hypothetical protein
MSFSHDIPTHLDVGDHIIGRLTARQLVQLAGGAFCCLGALRQPHLALAPRLGEGVLALMLTVLLVFVRPHGRSLLTWGRVATVWVLGRRLLSWESRSAVAPAAREQPVPPPPHVAGLTRAAAPRSISTPDPPRAPRRRPAVQEQAFIPTDVAEDSVIFADGRRCAMLECSGANTALMDTAALRAVNAAYHAFLVGLSFPVQMLVCASPIDLRRYSAAREARVVRLSTALRRLESADSAFMRREARRLGLLDHRMFVVVPAPDRAGPGSVAQPSLVFPPRRRRAAHSPVAVDADAQRVLHERCERVIVGLGAAKVRAWRLATPDLLDLWYRLLCPRSAQLQPLDPGHAAPAIRPLVTYRDST